MNLVEVVILVGSQCLSPIESGPGLTEVGKVPCAVVVRADPQTSEVEILPPSAATDPAVVAMLVKPRNVIVAGSIVSKEPAAADDITGSITRAPPHIVATSDTPEPEPAVTTPLVKTKPPSARAAVPRKRVVVTQRGDACGSYKAVWYTSKAGHKRYRCVRVS